MACLPADEDYARSVLAVFGLKNVRARESLPLRDIEAAFRDQNMGRAADLEAALLYATSQRWLSCALDRVRLTTLGAEEMQTISWPLRGADALPRGPRPVRPRL